MNDDSGTVWLKEIVVAVLAGVSLAALVFVYSRLIELPKTDTEIERARIANIEKVASGLFAIFAAFVGYYAGRIPAERSAAAAQQTANAHRQLADKKEEQVRRAKALLTQAVVDLAPTSVRASAVERQNLIPAIQSFLDERSEL